MKILLRRKKRKASRMIVVCRAQTRYQANGCGAVMQIKTKDIVRIVTKKNGIEYKFLCPECGNFTKIDVKDIPLAMRYKLSPIEEGPNRK